MLQSDEIVGVWVNGRTRVMQTEASKEQQSEEKAREHPWYSQYRTEPAVSTRAGGCEAKKALRPLDACIASVIQTNSPPVLQRIVRTLHY